MSWTVVELRFVDFQTVKYIVLVKQRIVYREVYAAFEISFFLETVVC